jgi:hypothetical protein
VLKMKMVKPKAAGARRGPTISPTAAATIEVTRREEDGRARC